MKKNRDILGIILVGVIVGIVAICLGIFGNPANMALCIACFIRDTAGALGLHRAEVVQYIRPEIIGIVLGAFVVSLVKREYAPKGGSAPLTRFVLGICVMVGALIFLGCPMRMVLRMAGGDLNAVIGFVGFVVGVLTGIFFLHKGFTLRRSYDQQPAEGALFPAINALLFVLLIAAPTFVFFSQSGPGSLHAPLLISLAAGLVIGVVAQRSRLCFIAGIRDAALLKQARMLICFVVILATVLIGNLATGKFKLSFAEQPIAHTEWLWNILGLYLVGFGSALLGGCPLRQLVMAGGGNGDAGVTVLGYLVGAAICHNFGLASSAAGTTLNGRIAFGVCVVVMFIVAITSSEDFKGKGRISK